MNHADLFLQRRMAHCKHNGGYFFCESRNTVTCKLCEKEVNPIYAIKMLAQQESGWMLTMEQFKREKAVLDKKRKTKCEHCEKMTRIRVTNTELHAVRKGEI